MNSQTSYSRPLPNGTQLSLTINCPLNQTGLKSSRTTQKTDAYALPPLMLTGTTHTGVQTRNPVLATRRFRQLSEIRSLPSLQTDHDDDSSMESYDTNDEYLTETHGRKLSFRECYLLACDRNPIYACMEHDLCEAEPQEKPENPTSEPTKSIKANKTPVQVKKKPIDCSKCRAHFLGVPVEKIKATFQATTQFATNVMAGNKILQTIKSPWPANNVRRRNEPVAKDTIKAQVPAVDNGSTMAQLFIGRKSLLSDAYGVKTDAAFNNTLEDNIRLRRAMDKLISDGAKAELSDRAQDILRALCIDDWHSEAHCQHQNFAEHC